MPKKILKGIVVSDKPKKTISVTDKFTGEKKLLYYYDWIPVDPNQGRLL